MNDETDAPGVVTSLARAAGSIWLISLCFIFVAMAVAALGFRLYYKGALAEPGETRRLELAREVVVYSDTLSTLIEDLREDRYYVPDPSRYAPPALQRQIDELVDENNRLRERPRNPGTPTGTGGGGGGPRPEPSDRDPG